MKQRLLLVTDSAALPSGMAETIRLIFESLLRFYPDEYDIHQVGLYHCYAVKCPQWPVYPTRVCQSTSGARFDETDLDGEFTVPEVVARINPDIVFAYNDPQRVVHLCHPRTKRDYRLLVYANFDGVGFEAEPHLVRLKAADMLVASSRFAMAVAKRLIPEHAENIGFEYTPADIERFRPTKDATGLRESALPKMFPQSAFILGYVGRNIWRKQAWALLATLRYLREGDYRVCSNCGSIVLKKFYGAQFSLPESLDRNQKKRCHCSADLKDAQPLLDVFLWMHTPLDDPSSAWPMASLHHYFGLTVGKDIYYTEDHMLKAALSPDDVPTLYQLWDCLLYLSGGEGFGNPVWEAMASGIPVVFTDYSSHAELVRGGNAGLPVEGTLQPEPHSTVWRMVPDIAEAVRAVRELYFDRELMKTLGKQGRSFVEQFSPKNQAKRWHERLQSLTREHF